MHFWDISWQVWLAFMLVMDFIAAQLGKGMTFSEHIWYWFSVTDHDEGWVWRRLTLYVFGLVLLAHLFFAISVWPLVLAAIPFAYVIVKRSSNMGKFWGWIKGGASKVWDVIKTKGPILTNIIGGVALLYPQYGVLINAVLGALGQGQAPTGTDLSKALAALATAGIAFYGALRKVIALWKASQQAPAK